MWLAWKELHVFKVMPRHVDMNKGLAKEETATASLMKCLNERGEYELPT